MSVIFISHSSKDNQSAAELRAFLERQGHNSIFLDFDPADGIPAGRSWEQELYARLRSSRAVIVLCSEASMRSDWCFAEITHARSLGKPIFPVKVAPCDLRAVLMDVQVIDLTHSVEEGYKRLQRGLLAAGLDPRDFFDWDGSRPPYPGLLSFQESDAAIFFGRDQDMQRGLDMLGQMQRFGGARMLLVLGASGSGKSSLVRAAILPRLKRDTTRWLVIETFRPSSDPLREFAHALSRTFERLDVQRDWQSLLQQLELAAGQGEPNGQLLYDIAVDLRTAAKQPESCVVLVIDQFEELLGSVTSERDHHFLALLRTILELPHNPWLTLGTLRSDFLGNFQNHSALRDLAFDSLNVAPFSADHFAQAIEGPAAVAGVELESGLVQAMIEDTKTQDALPLLAFTLRELWERYGNDNLLTVSEYRNQLGGLNGAVVKSAEGVMRAQPISDVDLDALRSALVSMVRINDEGQYARRLVTWDTLPPLSHPILDRFVDARLLVSRQTAQGRVLEVAHEALFRSWTQLTIWLDEDRERIHMRDGIRRAAQEWDAGGRTSALLVHRGPRSESAEALVQQSRFELGALARDYVQACADLRRAEQDAELLQERARRRRLKWVVISLAVGMLIVSGLGIWAFMLKDIAYQQHNIAMRRQSASEAVSIRQTQPVRSLLLAVEGMSPKTDKAPKWIPATSEALRTVASTVGGIPLWGHEDAVQDVSFDPTGKWLATASRDRRVRLWDRLNPQAPPLVLKGHTQGIRDVAFSHDGKWLASSSQDTTVRLWQVSNFQATPIVLKGHTASIEVVKFDPESQQIATVSKDGILRIWHVKN